MLTELSGRTFYVRALLIASVCVCVVGAVAAFVTTPLDVAKTRIMLAKVHKLTRAHAHEHVS